MFSEGETERKYNHNEAQDRFDPSETLFHEAEPSKTSFHEAKPSETSSHEAKPSETSIYETKLIEKSFHGVKLCENMTRWGPTTTSEHIVDLAT